MPIREMLREAIANVREMAPRESPERIIALMLSAESPSTTASAMTELFSYIIELEDRIKELETEIGRMEAAR